MPWGSCRYCEQPFQFAAKRGQPPAYCSRPHAAKALAERQKARKAAMERRKCSRCQEEKPKEEFGSPTAPYCRACHADYERERRKTRARQDPAYTRMLNLRRYGLTPEDVTRMLEAQGGRCAVCRADSPNGPGWHVDHDHSCCNTRKRSCGRCTRGLLCSRCNIAIGNMRDDPVILRAALDYVVAWRGIVDERRLGTG